MPVVLDATPGSPTANSFTTVAKATDYFSGHLFGAFWDDAAVTTDEKNRALITATRLIVQAFNSIGWQGWPVTSTQRLPLPRSGMVTVDGYAIPNTIIPIILEDATAELAGRLIQEEKLPDASTDTTGLKRLTAGPVEIEYFESGGPEWALPDAVIEMILPLTNHRTSKTSVPLVRV